jgi:hypothetical protein
MAAHRFRSLLQRPARSVATNEAASAFVSCPALLMGSFAPGHQLFVQEVYRLARERTESQLRPEESWPPVFSLDN